MSPEWFWGFTAGIWFTLIVQDLVVRFRKHKKN